MTVVHLPDYTVDNPYQSNLTGKMASFDEPVVISDREGVFRLFDSFRFYDDVSIMHLHWIHPYIFAGTKPRTVVKICLTLLQLLVIKSHGTAIVWTVHNVTAHDSKYPQLERLFVHLFVRCGLCDRICVHCDALAEYVAETYALSRETRENVVVVPHGHYIDNYENELDRDDARAALGIGRSERVFLFFGQVRPYKGVLRLVRAFESIARPDSRLLIVGSVNDDRMERRLRSARSDDRIETHLRFVPDDEIQTYMNAADAVVLPFRDIATSGSAVLAMSFGKALVVPRLGCIPETVDDRGAIVYDPDDPDALSRALRAAEERDLSAMGRHNYRQAKRYDWESIAKRTVAVYREVTGSTVGTARP